MELYSVAFKDVLITFRWVQLTSGFQKEMCVTSSVASFVKTRIFLGSFMHNTSDMTCLIIA